MLSLLVTATAFTSERILALTGNRSIALLQALLNYALLTLVFGTVHWGVGRGILGRCAKRRIVVRVKRHVVRFVGSARQWWRAGYALAAEPAVATLASASSALNSADGSPVDDTIPLAMDAAQSTDDASVEVGHLPSHDADREVVRSSHDVDREVVQHGSPLWLYALLALIDVEASFCIVTAYKYTSMVSVMVLDAWTVPCVLILGYGLFRWRRRREAVASTPLSSTQALLSSPKSTTSSGSDDLVPTLQDNSSPPHNAATALNTEAGKENTQEAAETTIALAIDDDPGAGARDGPPGTKEPGVLLAGPSATTSLPQPHELTTRRGIGVTICMIGLALLLWQDVSSVASTTTTSPPSRTSPNPVLGDTLAMAGATLYALSNVLQEHFVRSVRVVEVMAKLGLFGMVIAGVQMVVVEGRMLVHDIDWSPALGMLLRWVVVSLSLC